MYIEFYYDQNGVASDIINTVDDSVMYAFSKGLVCRKYLKKDWITTEPSVTQDISNTQEVEYITRMKITNSYVVEIPIYSFEKTYLYLMQFCKISLVDKYGRKHAVLQDNGMSEPLFEDKDNKNLSIATINFTTEGNLSVIAGIAN